jgi:hypothetical protein
MRSETGYCDKCGCEMDEWQLTVGGLIVCESCVKGFGPVLTTSARKPEARDDGR